MSALRSHAVCARGKIGCQIIDRDYRAQFLLYHLHRQSRERELSLDVHGLYVGYPTTTLLDCRDCPHSQHTSGGRTITGPRTFVLYRVGNSYDTTRRAPRTPSPRRRAPHARPPHPILWRRAPHTSPPRRRAPHARPTTLHTDTASGPGLASARPHHAPPRSPQPGPPSHTPNPPSHPHAPSPTSPGAFTNPPPPRLPNPPPPPRPPSARAPSATPPSTLPSLAPSPSATPAAASGKSTTSGASPTAQPNHPPAPMTPASDADHMDSLT
jgi:hypothetical protein